MSMLRELLERAIMLDASDVHLKPFREPFLRIHGQMRDSGFETLTPEYLQQVVDNILPPHLLSSFQAAHEADFSHQEESVGRFRVNIFVSQGVPAVAMRHVKTQIPTFEDLNLPLQLKNLATAHNGIILLTGTTGSGKSTTLAAILGEINRTQRVRIITVEDPVEYLFSDEQAVITQREVGLDTLSFENALQHLLRQDPDVILIGEMRDQTSIQTALLAAETGHLVLSTLHAATASHSVPRILDVLPTEMKDQIRLALSANLHAVICQRLVPCAQGGVVPAVEILHNTPTVRKLLARNQLDVLADAIETGREDGMQTFNQSLYQLIKSGRVTEREGLRFATNPEALRMNLQGIFLDESKRILSG